MESFAMQRLFSHPLARRTDGLLKAELASVVLPLTSSSLSPKKYPGLGSSSTCSDALFTPSHLPGVTYFQQIPSSLDVVLWVSWAPLCFDPLFPSVLQFEIFHLFWFC